MCVCGTTVGRGGGSGGCGWGDWWIDVCVCVVVWWCCGVRAVVWWCAWIVTALLWRMAASAGDGRNRSLEFYSALQPLSPATRPRAAGRHMREKTPRGNSSRSRPCMSQTGARALLEARIGPPNRTAQMFEVAQHPRACSHLAHPRVCAWRLCTAGSRLVCTDGSRLSCRLAQPSPASSAKTTLQWGGKSKAAWTHHVPESATIGNSSTCSPLTHEVGDSS